LGERWIAVVGLALIFGTGMRIAASAGSALWVVAWAAVSIWLVANPFLKEYLICAVALVGIALLNAGDTWGSA
jgi:thiosulfate dehydrogenase [quinone] large subunit